MNESFTILTYNVGNGRARPSRLAEMLRSSGADIIALQELRDDQAQELERGLSDLFPFRAVYPGGFAGKAILSRFPIQRAEQLHLSNQRPDLRTVLLLGARSLTVIAAHPPPPRPSPIKMRFDENTLAEIRSLAAMTCEGAPAVLLGDFNMTEANSEYSNIASAGLTDAFKSSGRGRGHTLPRRIGPWKRNQWLNGLIRWVPMLPVVRIDFIWHTEGLECLDAWVGRDAGSDHLPVIAVMRFEQAPA
jgi:vancomycin resistance protein VanJ